jgi:hypothetical protein
MLLNIRMNRVPYEEMCRVRNAVNAAIRGGKDIADITELLNKFKRLAPGDYEGCCNSLGRYGNFPVIETKRFDVLDQIWEERVAVRRADEFFAAVVLEAVRQPNTLTLEWLRGKRPDVGSWRSGHAVAHIVIQNKNLQWFEDHCSLPDLVLSHLALLEPPMVWCPEVLPKFIARACALEQAQGHALLYAELLQVAVENCMKFAGEYRKTKVAKCEAEIMSVFAGRREIVRRALMTNNGKALAELCSGFADPEMARRARDMLRRIGFTASDFAGAGVRPR